MLHFAVPVARISITSTRAVRNPREKQTNEGTVAVAGQGMIYLCFLFWTGGFCRCANPDFVRDLTKSACPTAAKKCLSTAICTHSRWRSQPLSGVSRKQRYNTLDFPWESRMPTGMLLAPIGNPEPKGLRPSGHPCFHRLCIYKPDSPCICHNLRKQRNPAEFISITG